MANNGLSGFCSEATYLSSFDILNIPSLVSLPTDSRVTSILGTAARNLIIYPSDPASIIFNNFTYQPTIAIPLTKPLLIQCPVPACIFPISGYFTLLQRILFYINMLVALIALNIPILRGVAQIWLTTFWFTALLMFLATIITTKVPAIYNLDLQPALIVVHTGLLPTLLWFSFRAEPGSPVEHSSSTVTKPRRGRWMRRLLDFPVTRILVPTYAIWGLMNVILAFQEQDSAGFWPSATAVVLSNSTSYLLTAPCFQDESGAVGLWSSGPAHYNAIRSLTSLSIYTPPDGVSAAAALEAVPRGDMPVLHVGTVVMSVMIVVLSFVKLTGLQRVLSRRLPTVQPQTLHYLAIAPFTVPLILAVAITLYVIVVYETNSRRAQLPENEAYTEIGQWGPYVTAFLVLIATLIAKWRGWDFDNEENSGFQWLLNAHNCENDKGDGLGSDWGRESLELLVKKDADITLLELGNLGWGDPPMRFSMLERRDMKRSRSF